MASTYRHQFLARNYTKNQHKFEIRHRDHEISHNHQQHLTAYTLDELRHELGMPRDINATKLITQLGCTSNGKLHDVIGKDLTDLVAAHRQVMNNLYGYSRPSRLISTLDLSQAMIFSVRKDTNKPSVHIDVKFRCDRIADLSNNIHIETPCQKCFNPSFQCPGHAGWIILGKRY
jgi:hypothetical protein